MTTKPLLETLSLGRARNQFSALVSAAEKGTSTVISKNGQPAAVIVPVDDARHLYPGLLPQPSEGKPSFADLLMSIPVPFVVRRRRSTNRRVEFLIDTPEHSDP